MGFIAMLLNRLLGLARFLSWAPPLLARFTLGWLFIQSGWGKLHHLDKVTAFFTSLGLPAPSFQAHLVATTEFAGGLLVLAGLCTRLAALPLSVIMGVAIATAKREELHSFSDLIGFPEYLYLVLLIWLAVAGPGVIALDTLISGRLKKLD